MTKISDLQEGLKKIRENSSKDQGTAPVIAVDVPESPDNDLKLPEFIQEFHVPAKQVKSWKTKMLEDAMKEAARLMASEKQIEVFRRYQNDPLGFGQNILRARYTDDIIKVMASVRDNPVTIVQSSNSVGKSYAAAHIALWWFSVYSDSEVFLTAAPPIDNLRRRIFAELSKEVRIHGNHYTWAIVQDLIVKDAIEGHEDHFIQGVSIPMTGTREERISKFSGRHAPHLLFIVDEGDGVPDEIYEAIDNCMTGGVARLLILFNPKMKAGAVYAKQRARLGKIIKVSSMTHPNVITGKNIIPGAITRDAVIRRINDWSRPLGPNEQDGMDCIEVPMFLVGLTTKSADGTIYPPLPPVKRKVLEPALFYSIFGEYPPQGEMQLISDEWIQRAIENWKRIDRKSALSKRPVVGVDVAEYGGDANALCSRYDNYVDYFKTWRGVDVDFSTHEIIYPFITSKNPNFIMVDATGLGSSVAPALARKLRVDRDNRSVREDLSLLPRPVAVKVGGSPSPMINTELGEFQNLRAQLWWATREWLKNDLDAAIPDDQELTDELRCPTYYKNLQGKIVITDKETMRDRLRRSPNKADALCLTFNPMRRAKVLRIGDFIDGQSDTDKADF